MVRTAWSDERLDDDASSIDPLDAHFDRLEARFDEVHKTLVRVGVAINVGIVGVIVAILARGLPG